MMTTIDPTILEYFGDEYQGYPLSLQSLGEKQWLIVLQAAPVCRLRLSAESDLTKKLDQMGFADESKIGDAKLDEHYVIRAESAEAQSLLANPTVSQAIHALTPFLELELTHKEYRLIKDDVSPTPQAIEALLAPLVQLVALTLAPEGSND